MPTWDELSEAERAAAMADKARGDPNREIIERYGITNPESAMRRLRGRLRQRRGELGDPDEVDNAQAIGVLEAWQEYQRKLQAMRQQGRRDETSIEVQDTKPIGIAFPADRHIGGEGTDHDAMMEHVKLLSETRGMYVIEGGDAVDNLIVPKFQDMGAANLAVDAQYAVYAEILRRLKPLCICHGNHDGWSTKYAGVDVLAGIADKLKLICAAPATRIDLRVGDQSYVIYRTHKSRYNSAFNLTHAVKRLWDMGPCDWDIGIVEHNHLPAMEVFYRHGEPKIALRPGTYKTRDARAMSEGFFGARIGVPIVFLWPNERRVQAWQEVDDVAGACKYLAWLRK